jgi:hypothetical protein
MQQDLDSLKRLYHERQSAWERNLFSELKSKSSKGTQLSRSLIEDTYIMAVGNLLLNDNIDEYVLKVNLILQLFYRLHEKYELGEKSYLISSWPMHHEFFFYALCINDLQAAKDFAALCDTKRLEPASQQHRFNVAFTQALKSVILGNLEEAKEWTEKFFGYCQTKTARIYEGYALALKSIVDRNSAGLLDSLGLIVSSYPSQTAMDEFFYGAEKANLCFYGVGLIHLARSKKMTIDFQHPLMPAVLTNLPEHVYKSFVPKGSFFSRLFKK